MAKISKQTLKRLASNKRGAAKSAKTYTSEVKSETPKTEKVELAKKESDGRRSKTTTTNRKAEATKRSISRQMKERNYAKAKSTKTPSPKMSESASKIAKGAGLAGAAKVAGAAAIPIGIAAATSAPALYEMKRQRTPLSEKEKARKEELSRSFNKHSKSERAEYIKLTAREGRTSKSAPKSETKPKEMPKAEKQKGGEVKTNEITKPAVTPKNEPSKVSTPEKSKTATEKKSGSAKWTPELNRLVKERDKAHKEGKSDYSKHLQNLINKKMGSKVRHKVSGTDRPAKAETYTDTHTGAKTEIVSRSNIKPPKTAKTEMPKSAVRARMERAQKQATTEKPVAKKEESNYKGRITVGRRKRK